jgi:hypothetical protein
MAVGVLHRTGTSFHWVLGGEISKTLHLESDVALMEACQREFLAVDRGMRNIQANGEMGFLFWPWEFTYLCMY